MSATTDARSASAVSNWRTPVVIIICGCIIALLSFGPRSSLGFFVQPMGREFAWGRDVFGLALALQNLLWGLGQPIAGAIADRFGIVRVMVVGALLYAGGLILMRYSTTPLSLDMGAGVLIGFGLVGLFVQSRAVGLQQAVAAREARHRARCRHRRRIVRPVPVRAVRRRHDRQFRLAGRAHGIWPADAADRAAVAGAGDAAAGRDRRAGRGSAIVQDGAGGSFWPPLLCAAGARLLHLRFSARLHHRASAALSGRSRHSRVDRRLGDRGDRPVQHHRLAQRRLSPEHLPQALHPVADLFHPRAVDPRLHLVPDHAVHGDRRSAPSAA